MSSSMGFSSDYVHLDQALRSRWKPFQDLKKEIADFLPKDISYYSKARDDQLAELISHNPKSSIEELASLVDEQISYLASADYQFHSQFWERFKVEYVTAIIMSAALCEAVINVILAAALTRDGTPEVFPILDKADLKQKWTLGPKLIDASYELPKSGPLFECLGMLVKQRNSFVHYKSELSVDGKVVVPGSKIERMTMENEIRWAGRFFSLPYDLAEYVLHRTGGKALFIGLLRREIDMAPEHSGQEAWKRERSE